jgi:hypothetical protein
MTLDDGLRDVLADPARRPSAGFTAQVMAALPDRQRSRIARVRAFAAPVAAAFVVVVLVVATSLGSVTRPDEDDAKVAQTPTSSPSPLASATPLTGTYADAIPRFIGLRQVFRGDAIGQEVARRTDDAPFLVGGYTIDMVTDCFVPSPAPSTPLLDACGGGMHLRDIPGDPPDAELGTRLVVGSIRGDIRGAGAHVFRVHVNDPRSQDCAPEIRRECERAVVVDAVVWPEIAAMPLDADGIPVVFDDLDVLRGDEITTHVAAAPDDTPFLIGGWASTEIGYRCAATGPELVPTQTQLDTAPSPAAGSDGYLPLLACGSPSILVVDGPGHQDGVTVRSAHGVALPPALRVVLRVHIHDPLANACPATYTFCSTTIVLDEVLWIGG